MTHEAPADLAERYRQGLLRHLDDSGDDGLAEAHDIAWARLKGGATLAEIALAHTAALYDLADRAALTRAMRERADRFLLELASVHDVALRDGVSASDHPVTDDIQRSIRELREERRRLDTAVQTLARSNREQAEFTYAISHDLKLPTNTLMMLFEELSVVLRDGIDPAVAELIHHGRTTALRMRQLVNDVLSYSRCVEPTVERLPFDLHELVGAVIADLDGDLSAAAATVAVAPLPRVLGVRMQMNQLFQNLVTNAIRFRDSARPLRIEIDCFQALDKVKVSVRDNGVGIAPQHLDRIFQPSRRLDGSAGGGIGLALCARIAASHGTRIDVVSEPGVGSCFSIVLERLRE